MRRRTRIALRIVGLVTGISFILFSPYWTYVLIPGILNGEIKVGNTNSMSSSSTNSGSMGMNGQSDENVSFMEGRLGMFSLIAKLMNNETFDILNITEEDFGISWYNISISSNGIINKDTGKPLFPSNENSSNSNQTNVENKNNDTKKETKKNVKKESFPIGGVEKKDYRVWSDSLQRNVKAEYIGERNFRGKVVYLYRTNAENETLSSGSGMFSMGGSESSSQGDNGLFGEGTKMFYDENNVYWLDRETSIPLNMEMGMKISMQMPNLRLLQVSVGERVYNSTGTIWVENDTIPQKYDQIEVIKESHTECWLDKKDSRIAHFRTWAVYYDNETKEMLPEDVQPIPESYAVDRLTYMYIPLYGGRSGYYWFPPLLEKRTYPMWDSTMQNTVDACFIEETVIAGYRAYLFELRAENITIESSNIALPVYRHPGTEYLYDSITRYWLEPETGMMLSYWMNGTFKLATGGPLQGISYPVVSFEFGLDENTSKLIAGYIPLLKLFYSLSFRKITLFTLELHFSDALVDMLLTLDVMFSNILKILRVYIPIAFLISGLVSVSIPTIGIVRERRRIRNCPIHGMKKIEIKKNTKKIERPRKQLNVYKKYVNALDISVDNM